MRELHGRAPRGLATVLATIHAAAAVRGLLVAATRACSAEQALTAVKSAARRRPSPRRTPRA